jgi:hypothetical protein
MKKFTIAEDELPFDFLEKISISWSNIALECIKKKFTDLSISECERIYNKNFDLLSDKLYELRDSDIINNNCIEEEEINESSGTWGYFHYVVDDVEKVKSELEEEIRDLLDDILNNITL